MNPIIRAQLDAFKASNKSENLQDFEFFEAFAIHAIENGMLTQNVSPFDVRLVGQEFGIDGIAVLIQGELCRDLDEAVQALAIGKNHLIEFHFFQAKTSESVDYGNLSKFLDGVHDFFTDGVLVNSPQVQDLRSVKDAIYKVPTRQNPVLRCFFSVTGSGAAAEPIVKLVDSNKLRIDDLSLFSTIEIEILGAKQLQAAFRAATNSVSATIEFTKAVTLPNHPKVAEAFIGFIDSEQLLKLVTHQDDLSATPKINRSVFYDNIRDFNPNSDINKSILSEIESGDLASFVFKNNGVTAIARKVTRQRDTFIVDDYQIVNGCQTSNILFLAGQKSTGISVPFRLIVSEDLDFISSIIIGTNKQNEVKDDQFWALSPFMKDLEIFCKSRPSDVAIFIERRENQYRDIEVERTRIFRPAELMKAVAAIYLHQPNRAARDYRGIRKEFQASVFQPDHNVELYHIAALASYRYDFAIRNKRVDKNWGIYKFYALFALGKSEYQAPDVLGASLKTQEKVRERIEKILGDDATWLKHIGSVANKLEEQIRIQGLDSREKVRDYLRTDTALESFRKGFFLTPESQVTSIPR